MDPGSSAGYSCLAIEHWNASPLFPTVKHTYRWTYTTIALVREDLNFLNCIKQTKKSSLFLRDAPATCCWRLHGSDKIWWAPKDQASMAQEVFEG